MCVCIYVFVYIFFCLSMHWILVPDSAADTPQMF